MKVVASSAAGLSLDITIAPDLANTIRETLPDSTRLYARPVLIAVRPGGAARVVRALGTEVSAVDLSALDSRPAAILPLAEVSRPVEVRGRRLAVVTVHPVQSDFVYTRVSVDIEFSGVAAAVSAEADPLFDDALAGVVANPSDAQAWRESRRAQRKVTSSPFAGTTDWYKLTVQSSGLYRLTGADLAAAGVPSGVAIADLRLFTGSGLQLPVDNAQPRPELREVGLWIDDGGDGRLDSQDRLYFYGEGLSRWFYPETGAPAWTSHAYDRHNVYWLTVGGTPGEGLRMAVADAAPTGLHDTLVSTYRHRTHLEIDSLFSRLGSDRLYDYYRWFWTDQELVQMYAQVLSPVAGATAEAVVVARQSIVASPTQLAVNGSSATILAANDSVASFASASLREGLNSLRVTLTPNTSIKSYLDYVDLIYQRHAAPIDDTLALEIGPGSGVARVELIDDFTTAPVILDISDPAAPIRLSNWVQAAGQVVFETSLDPVGYRRFLAVPLSKARTPLSVERTTVVDLRTGSEQADLIVVTARQFVSALEDYAVYRRSGGYSVRIVAVEDIYDNFALGVMDPAAIRDFLKHAYEAYPSPAPSAVLFVGDGNYDFLGIASQGGPMFVPPFIHGRDDSYSYSDDNYVYFGTYGALDSDSSYIHQADRGIDMLTARWPVRSADEIDAIVDKIRGYESSADFGAWRTTVCLVADDEFADGRTNETDHTIQTEQLQRDFLPRLYSRDKIYAVEYPFVGSRKPEVNEVIVNAINDGRLVVNYVGHGNPGTWAHEYIFTSLGDVPRLHNFDRLPLVFAASCAIGFYDDPGRQGMAEELLALPGGGAVAVISATRLVWSSLNESLNQLAFELLFGEQDLSICEALYLTKLIHQYAGSGSSLVRNDRSYILMGDPLMKLARPGLGVHVYSRPDTLTALRPARFTGHILDRDGDSLPVSGEIDVIVYDTDRNRVYDPVSSGGSGLPVQYAVDGAVIYRGSVPVSNGSFTAQFVPPLDIGYGGLCAHAKLYASLDTIDAAGLVDSMVVSDSVAEVSDTDGPLIEYSFSDRADFKSGDVVGSNEVLQIRLSDTSGINLTGALGHGITLEIDGRSEEQTSLTELFQYESGSFTNGTLEYGLSAMTAGWHRFKVKAWDNANNSTALEFDVEVVAGGDLAIRDLLNYPNPMSDSTVFSFVVTQPVQRLSLSIYTLSGRKICDFTRFSLESGFHDDIVWWGRDFAGDRVATGVYIYRAAALPLDGGSEVEEFGKVVVLQ